MSLPESSDGQTTTGAADEPDAVAADTDGSGTDAGPLDPTQLPAFDVADGDPGTVRHPSVGTAIMPATGEAFNTAVVADVLDEREPVGVDVGVAPTAVVVPRSCTNQTEFHESADVIWSNAARYADQLRRAVGRYPAVDVEPDAKGIDAAAQSVRRELSDAARGTVAAAIEAASGPAVLAVEHFPRSRRARAAAWDGSTADAWLPPTVVRFIAAAAVRRGVPVATVDRHGTTGTCHLCGASVEREPDEGDVRCPDPTCSVDAVGRDASAAASIARRV